MVPVCPFNPAKSSSNTEHTDWDVLSVANERDREKKREERRKLLQRSGKDIKKQPPRPVGGKKGFAICLEYIVSKDNTGMS